MDNVIAKPMLMVGNVRNVKMDSNFIPIALVKVNFISIDNYSLIYS